MGMHENTFPFIFLEINLVMSKSFQMRRSLAVEFDVIIIEYLRLEGISGRHSFNLCSPKLLVLNWKKKSVTVHFRICPLPCWFY